ncbi:hypothetical protein EV05_1789 [Prochlorococcus sp. MIT 0601]|nr:hypothetical protein EV05_1789 [Prochlorococcus sp. MIT 0601]
MIRIGYADNIHSLNKIIKEDINYELVDQRIGTKREYDLIKITIKETVPDSGILDDNYSKNTLKILSLLGWPVGINNNTYKKKLYAS